MRTVGDKAARRGYRHADVALAVLVTASVGLMVVPLPTPLLDVLLASNLAVSVAVLLVSLYAGTALDLATFPTLLLVTTLVRISLNVSTTRLILLQGDAGAVVRAFGSFVVSGNFVVGAVVFLILTIVQFVVVARGTERVAEVGARFSLDALPGKQMAIDAELRAGSLDVEGARKRRHALERESQFYGAMDGATRFVKGDVVASLLITLVNLTGGVAIGMGQRNLGFRGALEHYGLLTIGDGLVTQIPSLLLSMAAGLLVTRVAGEERGTPLGTDLAGELLRVPRALGVASGLVLVLALVPGLPAAPFLVIGVALAVGARAAKREEAPLTPAPGFVPVVAPWALEVSPDVSRALADERGHAAFVEGLRREVFVARGVPLPPASVAVDPELPDGHAVLSIHEVPAHVVALPRGLSAPDLVAELEERALSLLLGRAQDFVGIAETRALLDGLEQRSPATVRAVVPKLVDVPELADVLRRLVEEGVSIRDLAVVLEAVARAPAADRGPAALAEAARVELRRALTYDVTRGASALPVVLLDANIEDAVRASISSTSAGAFLTLSPGAARDIVAAVKRAFAEPGHAAERDARIVLTRPEIRRFVRKLIETDLPEVRVLSYAELLPELTLTTRGTATLSRL